MRQSGVVTAGGLERGRALASVALLSAVVAIAGEVWWWRSGGAVPARLALVGLAVATVAAVVLVASGALSRRPVPGLVRAALGTAVVACALLLLFLVASLSTN